jgi:predicted Zn-dependent peptidase
MSDQNRTIREITGDGSVLILDPHPGVEIVAAHLFMRMGSIYESKKNSGLSNLMQNLIMKGTESMDSEKLDERLDSIGSKLVSATGKEIGSLSLLTTRENMGEAMDLMVEVLCRPAMSSEEFEKERELVLDEIRQRRDELLAHAMDLFQSAFYGEHPLHKTVQGSEESVRALTLEEVESFRKRVYIPPNMTFSCAGDFEPEEVRSRLQRALEDIGRCGVSGENGLLERASESIAGETGGSDTEDGPREVLEERESSAAWIVLGYPAPSVGEEGYHEMQVVNAVLGGSMDSRLFSQLREKRGLAYQVSSIYRAFSGPSFLAGYIGTDPARYDEAVSELTAEIEKICLDVPRGEELERTKEYLKGAFLISGETMSSRAARRGNFEILGLGHDYGETYLKKIETVSTEGLKEVAQSYLKNYALGAVVPKKTKDQRAV